MSYLSDSGYGIASAGNTTTTALSGAATFTGTSEQNPFADVMCSCFSDVSGTLYFDFSVNGTDWRTYPVSGFKVNSGVHEFHTATKGPRHFRVRFVNDSSAQSTFQLYCYYGVFRASTNPLNQAIQVDSDAIVVRSSIAQDEISIGLRTGVSQFNKFAHRPDLDTADGEAFIIADSITNSPTLLTAAETYTITYTSGTDGAGGGATGALTLDFYHVDDDGVESLSTHTLGSTGSDVTSFSGYGINRCSLGSSGTAQANVNDIAITHTTDTGVAAFIPAGASVTQQAIFFTEITGKAIAKSLAINIGKLSSGTAPKVIVRGWKWSRLIDTKYEIFRHVMDTDIENTFDHSDPVGFPLEAGEVIWFTAQTDTNNTVIGSLRFSVNLYDNE